MSEEFKKGDIVEIIESGYSDFITGQKGIVRENKPLLIITMITGGYSKKDSVHYGNRWAFNIGDKRNKIRKVTKDESDRYFLMKLAEA